MSRNGSGTYTLPEGPFVPATPISSAAVNNDFDDIADALTDSLSRTGQGGMQAGLSLNIAGFFYGSDTDTGMSRSGPNTQVVTCGGSDVAEFTTAGLDVTGALLLNGAAILPIGLGPLPWSGLTAPSGWVLAYGQSLLRASYPAFWTFVQAEIAGGNALYTNGDGSTTFTVPDLRGRLPAGKDNMGGSAASRLTSATITSGANTLGNSGGEQTHVLTNGELATHNHAVFLNDPGHTHTGATGGATILVTSSGAASVMQPGGSIGSSTTGLQVRSASGGGGALNLTASSGNDTAHNNVQPTIITNYIIFAGA